MTVDNNILRITGAQVSDRGMYLCTAHNEGGSAQGAAIIEVERKFHLSPFFNLVGCEGQLVSVQNHRLQKAQEKGAQKEAEWDTIGSKNYKPKGCVREGTYWI